ncbi:DUF2620 family protein [Xenorhabdus japonica]|uniref:DUF2620 family protein n=1 Tax=Xenorhabdus japonica TaxID=53341 RepID=UPI000ADF0493|nr:DUF2620 family protein [Xenorhabdus japonica]
MAIKNGEADYYLGACNTGGGGALAIAIALIGLDQCATISMPGKILSDEEIITHVKAGKKAFGHAHRTDRLSGDQGDWPDELRRHDRKTRQH